MNNPDTSHPHYKVYISLLETAEKLLLKKYADTESIPTPTEFEKVVHETLCIAATDTPFADKIILTGAASFPDIVVDDYFGLEVKMTTADKWLSLGNSIMEGTRVPHVEQIHLCFGKFGGDFAVAFRPYEDCLSSIGVTHSPRYMIDMKLEAGKSIFTIMGTAYNTLRTSRNLIEQVRNYYRSTLQAGEELWWIDNSDRETIISPIIKPFSHRTAVEKEDFLVKTLALFPEIFGDNSTKYERVAAYLVTKYGEVSASLRDLYSAGGKVIVEIDGQKIEVPQLVSKLQLHAEKIRTVIDEARAEDLQQHWKVEAVPTDRLGLWLSLIDRYSNEDNAIILSKIYKSGLST